MSERGDIDLDHLKLAVEIGFRKLTAESEASVVDENFDWDVLVEQKVEDRLGRLRSPQICGEDVDVDLVLTFEPTGCRLERIALPCDQSEIEPVSRQDLRQLESDPAGAASDERSASLCSVPC